MGSWILEIDLSWVYIFVGKDTIDCLLLIDLLLNWLGGCLLIWLKYVLSRLVDAVFANISSRIFWW